MLLVVRLIQMVMVLQIHLTTVQEHLLEHLSMKMAVRLMTEPTERMGPTELTEPTEPMEQMTPKAQLKVQVNPMMTT